MKIKTDEYPYLCPNCGCPLWEISEESLAKGDDPTISKCIKCGFQTHI